MTLRKKTFLIMSFTLFALLVLLYFVSDHILMDGFAEVEEDDSKQDVQRAVDTLNDSIAVFSRTANDWANWDDTYSYIQDENTEYVDSNLSTDTSWVNNEINVMVFLDASGRVIYQSAYDLVAEEFVPVPDSLAKQLVPGSQLIPPGEADAEVSGLLMLPENPMIFTARPIFPSLTDKPANGTLIWGRYLDESEIESLSNTTHSSLSFFRLDQDDIPATGLEARSRITPESEIALTNLDDETIAGYAQFDDVFGEPALLLQVDQPRDIHEQGTASMRYLLFSILGVAMAFGLVTTALIERAVLARVSYISHEVEEIETSSSHSERLVMPGNDELSAMAGKINDMLNALESSQNALQDARDKLEVRVYERTNELRQHVALLEALTEVGSDVLATIDSNSIKKLVCQRTAELLQVPKAILVAEEDSPDRHTTASYGLDRFKPRDEIMQTVIENESISEAFSHQRAFIFQDQPENSLLLAEIREAEQVKAMAIAPLKAEGRVFGALLIFDTSERSWSGYEINALEMLAKQASLALDTAKLFNAEQVRRSELSSLYNLSRLLADCPPNEHALLDLVAHHSVKTIDVTFTSILLLEEGIISTKAIYPRRDLKKHDETAQSFRLDDSTNLRQILANNRPTLLSLNTPSLSEVERELLFANNAVNICVVPLHTGERTYGFICFGEARSDEREPFTAEKLSLVGGISDQTASALTRAELFDELENAYLQTVLSLAAAVDAKDRYTADHGERMSEMAVSVGKKMGMKPAEIDDLRYGAQLHDVGKIGIPDAILNKPGNLDDEEWTIMRKHPAMGETILKPYPHFKGVAVIVRHHHERYEGGGYPDGIRGDDIPLAARILTVIDSYSAMTDKRVYKKALNHEAAVAELKKCSGTQFDPKIVETFLSLYTQSTVPAR